MLLNKCCSDNVEFNVEVEGMDTSKFGKVVGDVRPRLKTPYTILNTKGSTAAELDRVPIVV